MQSQKSLELSFDQLYKGNLQKKNQAKCAKQINKLKLSEHDNPQEFVLSKFSQGYEKFLCYIKCKVMKKVGDKQLEVINVKGSGILIQKNYVLTAAHNVHPYIEALKKLKNLKSNPLDISYVKQGLLGGNFLCKYKIVDVFISKYYLPRCDLGLASGTKINITQKVEEKEKHNKHDYALIKVQPFQQYKDYKIQEAYPLFLALQEENVINLKNIKVYGYPVDVNKQCLQKKPHLYSVSAEINLLHKDQAVDKQAYKESQPDDIDYMNDSSFYMGQAYKMQGKPKELISYVIKYDLPTESGISGGPIVAEYKGHKIIIGLHKATQKGKGESDNMKKIILTQVEKDQKKKEKFNIGVCCFLMMQEFNEIGFSKLKRPLIYSEKTLNLRQNINNVWLQDNLNKVDRNYSSIDIRVIISYDISNIKRLYLSGNRLRKEGFICLTQRAFPNIKSIYLATNQISDLNKIDQKNWKNIENVSTLSLSINYMKTLPDELALLKKLYKLWLPFNPFKRIPEGLLKLAEINAQKQRKVYFYSTKIFKYSHTEEDDNYNKDMILKLKQTGTNLITEYPLDIKAEGKDQGIVQ